MKASKAELTILKDSLLQVKEWALSDQSKLRVDVGVCWNVYNVNKSAVTAIKTVIILGNLFQGFKGNSGHFITLLDYAENINIGKWQGSNLQLRVSLIDYAINKIEGIL